jgi:DNA-binding GntR family transcriptional regulator
MASQALEAQLGQSGDQQRIVRRSLHDEVVDRLRDMILSGQFEEGARLRGQQLCEQLGISRTPLREAFKVLASEGLLELLPNRGARVPRLSQTELEQMFEVMAELDGLAGELACQRITEEEVEKIRRLHDAMVSCFHRDDLLQLFKIDQEIHQRIVRAARNDVLEGYYGSLAARMRRARFMGARRDAQQRSLMEDHMKMIAALAERNGTRLGQIMREHIRKKGVIARNTIVTDTGSE